MKQINAQDVLDIAMAGTSATLLAKRWESALLVNVDNDKQYPDLYVGEKRILSYGKQGYTSTGEIIKTVNGKIISQKTIRKDRYASTRDVVVVGTAKQVEEQLNVG
jgi:hypothetical protein